MKFNKYLLGVFTLLLFFSFASYAQEEKKMTKDEWQAEMTSLQTQKESLNKEISSMQADVNNLKDQSSKIESYDNCMQELYAMVGATEADVNNFRTAVNDLQGKISRKEGPKADRQKRSRCIKNE